MNALVKFAKDEEGASGAEVALLCLVALGLILFVANFIKDGAKTAATKAKGQLEGQNGGKNVVLQ